MDPCFELTDRDGLARRGRIKTPHGIVHTPVLFPVLHPDPARQLVTVREIRERFHVEAVMTSSYILRRNEELAQRAIEKGIHSLLGFDGAVVTDSGAFQQHVYGEVEASPSEILEFQNAIGTDVATPLDLFVEPSSPREEAEAGVVETLRRVTEARKIRGDRILAVPVQGGLFADLRRKSAEGSEPLADILAVGGIVPLMDSYRFADLFRMLSEVRSSLAPEKPLHLFGLGHPMLFAFGALLGADIFDTASYHKFARRLSLQFPQGSMDLDEVREDFCGCALCDR
ncbi:MAG: tRNA-guanine transglycosylase, partial [Candidatus Thermoplasmatota archaeon]|nr:tRNA-guanine transglycosylase [Candidatus Thermoplasmatota archaeon]